MYTAFSGLKAQMNALEMLSNNLANLNTPGFKEQKAFFTVMNQTLAAVDASDLNAAINNHSVLAHGTLNLREGSLRATGRELDLALVGNGFLSIETPAGPRYTRNGNLTLNNKVVLSTQEGFPVVGEKGPIALGPGKVTINDAGEVFLDETRVDRLKLVTFDNPLTLQKEGNSLLKPGDGTTVPKPSTSISVRQSYLEESNVNPVLAAVEMIGILRQFEAMQKSVNLLMNEMNTKAIERLAR